MKTDIEIARECTLANINDVAQQINIPTDQLELHGRHIAKVPITLINDEKIKNSNLILVTAITPTKAGIGKTTVSIGLALGLNKIGKKAVVALREPSLGPCFGMKGGAAGGGYGKGGAYCAMAGRNELPPKADGTADGSGAAYVPAGL